MQRVRNIKRPSPAVKAVMAGQPAPSCAVVGESELSRIMDIANQKDAEDARAQQDRREQLRTVSEARVSNWPNTIEAQRMRKDRVRRERLDEEEKRRQVIDMQETELAKAKKDHAIRKANLQLYENNDRIKTFSSKLFLTTVLEEREKQFAIEDEKKRRAKEDDQKWAVLQQEELRQAEAEEVRKLGALKDRSLLLKQEQLQQLEDIRQIKLGEREEGRQEGRRILEAAQDAVREERAAETKRRDAQKLIAKELVETNKANLEFKRSRHERERKEQEEVAEYARMKEQQMLDRKKRVDEKFAAKLKRRQDIINDQAIRLEEIKNNIEEREMRAMRDFERERNERENREQAERDRRQKEIDDFKTEQRAKQRATKAKQEEEKARMQVIWKERAELLIDEELEEQEAARKKAERLQRFQLLQAQEKRAQRLHEKRQDIEEGIKLQEALREEQDMYHDYVNSVMDEYVRKGRSADIVKAASHKTKVKTPPESYL